MPAYNASRHIDETLRSIFSQTLKPDEIIVVDDCSTDDTVERLKAYGGAVRLIRCSRNSGGCGTPRNIGIDAARTTYVAPFDSDDIMHPTNLQRHMQAALAAPKAGMCFVDYVWLHAPGMRGPLAPHTLTHTCCRPDLQPLGNHIYFLRQEDAYEAFMHDNYVGASGLMFSKATWRAVGGYNEKLQSAEDLDFSMRLAERFAFVFVDEPLYSYRVHPCSMSANRMKILSYATSVLKRYLDKCPSQRALRGLREQLWEMESDMVWHCIEGGRFGEAAAHWYAALQFGGLRQRLVRLSGKLAIHSAVVACKKWLPVARRRKAA